MKYVVENLEVPGEVPSEVPSKVPSEVSKTDQAKGVRHWFKKEIT